MIPINRACRRDIRMAVKWTSNGRGASGHGGFEAFADLSEEQDEPFRFCAAASTICRLTSYYRLFPSARRNLSHEQHRREPLSIKFWRAQWKRWSSYRRELHRSTERQCTLHSGATVRFAGLEGIGPNDVEHSFRDRASATFGEPGSVRTDVVLRNAAGDVIAIYDVKTGGAKLTPGRVRELRNKTGVGPNVPIIELHVLRGARFDKTRSWRR